MTGEVEDSVWRNKMEKTEHMGRIEDRYSKEGWRAADKEDGK